jgi:hypothetical protein
MGEGIHAEAALMRREAGAHEGWDAKVKARSGAHLASWMGA